MNLWNLTDLHLNFGKIKIKKYPKADVVALNGDLSNKLGSWSFIKDLLDRGYKVILILGNHEYYSTSDNHVSTMKEIENEWKIKESKYDDFHVLINETLIIDNYRFVGTTLWTDFNNEDEKSMDYFNNKMGDSFSIYKSYKGEKNRRKGGVNVNAKDILSLHYESKNFLINELEKDFKGVTVVLSHHAPSFKSINSKYKNDKAGSGNFASDLEELIYKYNIDFWFHGHVHETLKYSLYSTWIICNPLGYYGKDLNVDFNENYILNLEDLKSNKKA